MFTMLSKSTGKGSGAVKYISLLALAITGSSALSQQYCSNQNTGSDSSAVTNPYQSNGRCSDTCKGYAFAVVQGKSCWCSNYIPAAQSSTGSCSASCPGYPYESCGDQSSGLFGYVALGPSPSGTQGAAASSSEDSPTATSNQAVSTNSPSIVTAGSLPSASSPGITPSVQGPVSLTLGSSSFSSNIVSTVIPTGDVMTLSVQSSSADRAVTTVQDTVTATPAVQVSYISLTASTPPPVTVSVQPSTSSTPPTTLATSTSSPTSSSTLAWTPVPVISIETVTGQIKTLTITPTAPPAPVQTVVKPTNSGNNNGGFFNSPGKVAGVFVVVALLIIAIGAVIVWACLRRKQNREAVLPIPSNNGGDTPQRRPSRLSQMALIGNASSHTQKAATPPTIQTSGWGPGNTHSAEKSPADTLDRRSSFPRVVDQRLEPTALWNPLHDNGSHVSVRSFRDDQDYSRRMLRIANPDDR